MTHLRLFVVHHAFHYKKRQNFQLEKKSSVADLFYHKYGAINRQQGFPETMKIVFQDNE